MAGGDLLLSFDVTVSLNNGIVADDEDLVRLDGSGGFSLALDGTSAGVPAELDLDGAHYLEENGRFLVSFDGSGVIHSVRFDDEDVLEVDPAGGGWRLVFDGSSVHAGWSSADLDALHSSPTVEPLTGDIDRDGDVDATDVRSVLLARGSWPIPDDPRDIDGDGRITVLDARRCVLLCTRQRCAP